jgi:HemY protein
MLWSILKIVVFLAVAAGLAFGAQYLLEAPGEVTIAFQGREFELTPLGFVIAVIALMIAAYLAIKLVGLLVATIRFLTGDETALSRFFSRNRERRGLDALSGGMAALASGEPALAMRKLGRAERLLARPELTGLVRAQAAELAGDRRGAMEANARLLTDQRTRLAGIHGATRLKLGEGDVDTALALAKQAFALRPDNEPMLRTLFELQSKKEDWAGARETLNAALHARLLPRDVAARRDAVLSLADARRSMAEGQTARGREAAKQANKLAPTLVPAATAAAEAFTAENAKRRAAKALTTAWAANPHPDLAAAFAAIEPGESPSARRKRFETLTAANPNHAESKLLAAELALADEDFPGARRALGDLAETEPTARSLALMAAIERGQGAPEEVVRGWLGKAVVASRGPRWLCGKCNHVHAAWVPVCENCGAFDTLDWRTPPHAHGAGLAQSAMLPLIVGADRPAKAPEAAVEEAEVAAERA